MTQAYNEYNATSPELATAVSIFRNDMKLGMIVEVVDRGAVSGIIELNITFDNGQLSEKLSRLFTATMKDNGFIVLEILWDEVLMLNNIKIRRR